MTRRTARTAPTLVLVAAALALVLSLGACSSDGDDATASTTTVAAAATTDVPADPSADTTSATTTASPPATTASPPATTAAASSEAPCTITGAVTGAQEQTWTDAPVDLVTEGVVLPTGGTATARFTADDGQTLLNVYAAGTGPALVQYGVVGGAGSKTYASTSPGATNVTASGGSVEADAVAGSEAVTISAEITCT